MTVKNLEGGSSILVSNGGLKLGWHWIDAKDKLPEPNNWILYAVLTREDKLYRHQIAYYSTSNEWFMENYQKTPIKVTHWVPLPPLPL